MSRLIARLLLPGTALLLASCSSTPAANPSAPTKFGGGSSVAITASALAPTQVSPPPMGCPVATPLFSPFLVTVTPVGSVTIVVTSITTQFTGSGNIPAPPVTLPAPVPTTQYGTALQQAKNAQSFSLGVCRGASAGNVGIIVGTVDMFGRSATSSTTVAVN